MAARLYEIAVGWEDALDEDRDLLKTVVSRLVGYPCRLACDPGDDSVDIHVYSVPRNRVLDWIEIQNTGALGVIFELYPNPDAPAVDRLDERCMEYNDENEVVFVEGESDSGSDSEISDS